jgi:hypothetical protein
LTCESETRETREPLEPRRTSRRPAGESKTGESPGTPSIVSRTCKLSPAGRAWDTVKRSRTRAPFCLLSIRAPRQAALRTSSWLAPFETPTGLATSRCERRAMHPTDFCHPNETACAHTSCVPGSLSPLSRRGCPTESWAPYGVTGGQDVFTTSRTASADRHRHVTFALQPHGLGHEAWALSAHGVDAIEPLTPLSRSLVHPRASPAFAGAASSPCPPALGQRPRVARMRKSAKTTRERRA